MKFNALITMTIILAAIFCFTAISQDASAAPKKQILTAGHKDLACEDCHKTKNPTKMPNHSVCSECHGTNGDSYKGEMRTYINGDKPRQFNVHDSHQGPVRCTVCHATHKKPAEPMHCNWCHQIKVEVK